MPSIAIVGIGNIYRGDDAVGWAVIDQLKEKVGAVIQLCKQRGDIAELMEVFAKHPNVYLVDACLSTAPVGSWRRIDAMRQPLPIESSQTSTHGFSISQTVALAKSMNQLPSKLIIYAIIGSNYAMSEALSPLLAQAVNQVAEAILNEEDIRTCMKKA